MAPATDTRPSRPGRADRLAPPLVLAGVAAAGALALNLRDPHTNAWVACPFHAMTGLWCPGCGSLRAVNDLTHGDVVAAASSNLAFVVALPLLAALWLAWTRRAWTGAPRPRRGVPPLAVWALLVPLLVFSVLRNLPAGSWLAP